MSKLTKALSTFFNSISFRLTAGITALFVLFFHIGVFLTLYRSHQRLVALNSAYVTHFCLSHCADLDRPVIMMLGQSRERMDVIIAPLYERLSGNYRYISHFSIAFPNSPEGTVVQRGMQIPNAQLLAPLVKDATGNYVRELNVGGKGVMLASRPVIQGGKMIGVINAGMTGMTFQETIFGRAKVYWVSMVFFLSLMIILASLMVSFSTRSIRSTVSYIHAIERGEYKTEIPVKSPDEGGAMAEAFNTMLRRLNNSYIKTLGALAALLETKDRTTETHSIRVVMYALELGKAAGLSMQDITDLEYGALLHDIGKIGVEDNILRKCGPLTEDEWEVIRQHPTIGYSVLKDLDFLKNAMPVVLHHQERYDGHGYPNGLKGEEIPILARIFTIADSFEAMISDRPYRKAMRPEQAIREIRRNAGTQFDPRLAELFAKLYDEGKIKASENTKVAS